MRNRIIAACAVLVLWVVPASALTPGELLTPELERLPINLSGLGGGQLQYFDQQRRLTTRPVSEFVRLSFRHAAASAEATDSAFDAPLMIELVDGQRLAGRWAGAAQDGEAIVWEHPTLGRFTLGLDDVRSVTRRGPDAETTADLGTPESDVLLLGNGDRLTGFVVAVDEQAVTLQPDGSDALVDLPVVNLASLTLANAATPHTTEGDLVALADGSRVRGTGVAVRGDGFSFTPLLADALLAVDLGLTDVRSVDFAASGVRLVELTTRPMQTVDGGGAFGLPLPPTVDAAGIRLHAPVTVRFDLPEGARRFAARAALDLPTGLPDDRARLADLVLWVGVDESFALREKTPAAVINLPLDPAASALTLRVDPARHGPVLDRLRLTDAVLLLDTPDPPPASGNPDR